MKRRATASAVAAGVLAAAAAARAQPAAQLPALPARDDAYTAPAGGLSFGVWSPLRYAVSDRVELSAHPLLFFVAPHLQAQVRHLAVGGWQVSGLYGLSLPSPAMRLLQGHLFPSWDRGGGEVGWTLVPRVGLLASRGARAAAVTTLRADLALGVPLVPTDARPLGTLAPLDLLFDPVLAGYRARVGAGYDRALGRRWRWRVLADVYLHGVDEDLPPGPLGHLTFRAGAGLDAALGRRTRLILGLYAWNDFQHEVDGAGDPVRSNLFLPAIDLLWSTPP
jgi:hypothetical protein